MIPIAGDVPRTGRPMVNALLLLVNAGAFLYQQTLPPLEAGQIYFRLGCIPREIVHLIDTGPSALVPLPLTLVTSLFLHEGWIHLILNMLFLWVFGNGVEARLGHLRYAAFFLGCGAAASMTQAAFHPASNIPVVGAGGAVSAVMAAYLVFHPTARIKTLAFWFLPVRVVRIPAPVFLGAWIAARFVAGLSQQAGNDGVAWFAHLGGFSAGLAVGLKTRYRKRDRSKRKKRK
ncbi:MAG: rhomboid family intramembrane serine protease [Deltaproteobacteria bacterium]|nr:rhomboid family intramembrane serine protease [Deltaproteobacteria bacterium]